MVNETRPTSKINAMSLLLSCHEVEKAIWQKGVSMVSVLLDHGENIFLCTL